MTPNRYNLLAQELKHHAPFTLLGACTGIICMLLFKHTGQTVNLRMFQVFHPTHVFLSAVVTASLFRLRSGKASLLSILLVGYFGSIGVATLSDCVIPFFGEDILGATIPSHGALHETTPQPSADQADDGQEAGHTHSGPHLHLGFIEEWYIVNPAALLGILLAFYIPHDKLHTALPHAGHVLISTWASSFHVLMNMTGPFTATLLLGFLIVLFIAVWVPCCISDIVFPLLFVGPEHVPTCCHGHHPKEDSHEH